MVIFVLGRTCQLLLCWGRFWYLAASPSLKSSSTERTLHLLSPPPVAHLHWASDCKILAVSWLFFFFFNFILFGSWFTKQVRKYISEIRWSIKICDIKLSQRNLPSQTQTETALVKMRWSIDVAPAPNGVCFTQRQCAVGSCRWRTHKSHGFPVSSLLLQLSVVQKG